VDFRGGDKNVAVALHRVGVVKRPRSALKGD